MKILDFNGLKSFTNKIKEKLTDKQDILVSGDNIATINNKSLLDGGNIDIKMNMSIRGTINLTDSSVYSYIFSDMEVNEMRMYLVSDSQGNLPSQNETAITVPYDGILSPTYLYFGKSSSFGVSVGDICVFYKKSALLNVCRILPLNDAKPSNGDFPGADGLETVWDKNRINKIDGIEWTANHVRDNYLPKADRNPSRHDWLINVDNCLENGVYPTCDTASLGLDLDWQNQYTTVVVQRTSTEDNGGYHTIEQTAYGRGNDEGRISKRIIFYNPNTNHKQYGSWNVITYKGSGTYSTAVGYVAKATANNSTALGPAASAHGAFSIALGCEAETTADYSMALGSSAKAMGENSISLGGIASGSSSIALGGWCERKTILLNGFGGTNRGNRIQLNSFRALYICDQ